MGLIERMTPVAGLRVLISGGASGIGEAIAAAFLEAKALVHVCDVSQPTLAAFREKNPGEDLMTGDSKNRTVMVPVKFLEHSRFRLADPSSQQGAGQGQGQPGDVLQPGRDKGD